MFRCLLALFQAITALPALQIRQASCLGVNILNLLITLRIKAYKFLTSRRAQCFLKV